VTGITADSMSTAVEASKTGVFITPPPLTAKRQRLCLAALAGVLLLVLIAPYEDAMALLVAAGCATAALAALTLVRDRRERHLLMLLFLTAFGLRLVFTVFVYQTALIQSFGGGDDIGWVIRWKLSRIWQGWFTHDWFGDLAVHRLNFREETYAATLWEVYDGSRQRNRGYAFFVTWFYYLIDARSQMALAIFNSFLNAVTVLVIYRTARLFFSREAALFAAAVATILPSFLVFSALTIKESWIVLCEVAACYALLRYVYSRHWAYLCLCATFILLVGGFRFYAGWTTLSAVGITFLCFSSRRSKLAGIGALTAVAAVLLAVDANDATDRHLSQGLTSLLDDITHFRTVVSSNDPRFSTGSAVPLDYDLHTPDGLAMQVAVGGSYLLLAPFPWETLSGRQLYALPDVCLWWIVFFCFVVPGAISLRRTHPALLTSLLSFIVPLFLFCSLTFGNIGLGHRQRAQLVPFLLVMAAAGYEARKGRWRGRISNKAGLPPGDIVASSSIS